MGSHGVSEVKYPNSETDLKVEQLVRKGRKPGNARTKIYNPGDTLDVYVNGRKVKVRLPR